MTHINPPRKRRKWPFVLGGVAAVIVIGSCAANAASPSTPTSVRTTAPISIPTQQPTPTTDAPVGELSDGFYEVGVDVDPGRYKTVGPGGTASYDMCFWSREKNDSGEFDAIIANDVVKGPGVVTVKAGEFLKLSGGCEWVKQ